MHEDRVSVSAVLCLGSLVVRPHAHTHVHTSLVNSSVNDLAVAVLSPFQTA